MPVSSRALVDLVLLGPTNDRRQLQDSPVLGDVWLEYAARPIDELDVERKKEWEKKHKTPKWSVNKQSLSAFFAANKDFAKKVQIVDKDEAHLINLLDKI